MESHTVGTEGQREQVRVAYCLRSLDEAIRGIHRLPTGTGHCKGVNQPCPDVDVSVAAACELGAAQLGQPLGLPDDEVDKSKHGFDAVRRRVAAHAENDLPSLAVADSR